MTPRQVEDTVTWLFISVSVHLLRLVGAGGAASPRQTLPRAAPCSSVVLAHCYSAAREPRHARSKPWGSNLGVSTVSLVRNSSGVCPPRAGMGSSVRLLLCLVLIAVVAANNSTEAREKKERQTQSVITMAWGIFGFFVFTSTINVTGILYDRKMGNNKVADGGDA